MEIGKDYIGTSSGAVVFDDSGKIFMVQRGSAARDDVGKWEFPGGAIHFHETRSEAAKRNIKEKYNIEIEPFQILGVYDVIDKEVNDHWISTTFICKHTSGEPEIIYPKKCQKFGWFDLGEIGKMDLSRITKLNYADLVKWRGFFEKRENGTEKG